MNNTLHQAAPVPLSTIRVRSFWPRDSHEALLRAALAQPPQLATAVYRWCAISSLDSLDYASLTILPLLYRNLCRYDFDRDLRERIKGVYRWSWHRNQLLVAALRGALTGLREAGVEVTVMKGVPLALSVYPDLGARVMGDADLIVRHSCVAEAVEVLTSAGWTAEREIDEATFASLCGVNLRHRGRCIDLHWHVLPDNFDDRRDDQLLERAVPIEIGEVPVGCLEPADHLLEILCHGLSWAANTPIHWVADATLLLDAERDAIDWDRFVEQARLNRRVRCVHAALRYLAVSFDAHVPSEVLAKFDRLRVGIAERVGFWFAEHSDGDWPWGRAPLVAAMYVRSSRARGRWPGLVGFLRFVSTRADCTPSQWLHRAAADSWRHLRRMVSMMAGRAGSLEEGV